jgi:RNA polymerase sigma-70 factor (ECF subfamily)
MEARMTSDMLRRFEEERPRLRALAQRMLSSWTDAEDALQETWLRVSRVDATSIDNPGGWLTTVTARVCLNILRARAARPEDPASPALADLGRATDDNPAHEAALGDAVGMAMLVVLDSLTPAERVAFVLHDMFAVPFEEIAAIVNQSVESTRQLASRARRRVRPTDDEPIEARPDVDRSRQRELVDAFFATARNGDLTALISVLHPEVGLGAVGGLAREQVVVGAAAVAGRATMFANPVATLVPVMVDGEAGVVVEVAGRVIALMVFTVRGNVVVAIEATTDRDRLARIVREPR